MLHKNSHIINKSRIIIQDLLNKKYKKKIDKKYLKTILLYI